MTIEYKDSKRIVALSTDVVETLDYSDDFSSDGYTDVGSNVGVSSGKMKFTNTAGGDNRSHKSLGITLDSNFISRFEYKRLSTTSGNIPTYPVVFTATNSDPEADNDFIAIRVDSGGTAHLTVDDGTTNTVTSGITISNDVNYFIELKREGTTSYLSIKTGSHTGSDISGSPVNLSTPATVTGLTTVQHAVKSNQTGGSYNAEIDNLEIYNGETSLTSKPTNVQDNSLLVEKDTARRYWFDANPLLDDDFSTDDWTDSGANVGISNGVMNFDIDRTTTDQSSYYTLSRALSDTKWTMRLHDVIVTTKSGGVEVFIGVSSNTSGAQTAQDFIGLNLGDNTANPVLGGVDSDGAVIARLAGDYTYSLSTTYNIEIIRESATSYRIKVFSNSGFDSTALFSQSYTCTATTTGLQYVKFANGQIAGSTENIIGTCSKVEIFDGVTTASGGGHWTKQPSIIPTVAGLKLHLDASDISTITKDSSNYVSAWNDKSGEGNHLTQSTASKQPLIVTNALDTLPIIRFDGSDDFMNRSTFVNGAISQGFYMFVVMKPSSSGVSYNFDSAAGTRGFCYSNNTVIQYGCGTDIQIDSTIPTTHVMYTFFVNGASSNVRKNSTSINSSNLGSSTINGLWLATRYNEANKGNVEFAEVLIYDNDIGTTNRDAIESYLTDKWGL